MKNLRIVVLLAMAMLFVSSFAQATPKYVDMGKAPTLSGDTVDIGNVPSGYTLVDVTIYDDVRGIPGRSIGAKTSFELKPGEGFNFVVKHPDGEFWQMITRKAQAGRGLWIDCQDTGCKYYRPMPEEQPPVKTAQH